MPTAQTSIVRVCLLVLAGGFAAQHSRVLFSSEQCYALFAVAVLLLPIRRVRQLGIGLLGFVLFMHAGLQIIDARLHSKFAGESLLTQVRIADFPKRTGLSYSFTVEPAAAKYSNNRSDHRIPLRSRVSWFDPQVAPEIGDIWELELRLKRPRGSSNPGGFSYENWTFREHIHAVGYVVPGQRNQLVAAQQLSFVDTVRRDFVREAINVDSNAAPVLVAVGVGTRHLLTAEQWQRFAVTGTSHLIAISGLHIGLAAAATYALLAPLLGLLRCPGNTLRTASLFALICASAYAILSGLGVPAQRALLMLVVVTATFVSRRSVDFPRTVALSALVVYWLDPVSSMAPGFVLSYGAVIALLWFGRSYSRCAGFSRPLQVLRMQVALLFALAPITAWLFQRISLTAPMINLLVVPVFSIVSVPLILASLALAPVWQDGSHFSLEIAAVSINLIEALIVFVADAPISNTVIAGMAGWDSGIVLVIALPALWIALPRGWPGRELSILALLVLFDFKPSAPPRACFDTQVLDVGQGLAVVVRTDTSSLLFDTGAAYRSGSSAVDRTVMPFLQYQGVRALDWLVVSHADNDHAGGFRVLANAIEIKNIFAGEVLPDIGRDVKACVAGNRWNKDGVDFQFLHPTAASTLTGNDASCVLLISAGEERLLLTGDIEKTAERQLLERISFASARVVLVPHHGSSTSSSPALVQRLRPKMAIVSAGYGNRWGFPDERVVGRWNAEGATVLATSGSGAIGFRLCSNGKLSALKLERERQRRFWHDL